MSVKQIDTAIITTILFFEIFSHALTVEEIYNFLYSKESVDKTLLTTRLKALQDAGTIHCSGQYYYINNEDAVAQALHAKALRQKCAPKIKKAARILSYIPFIKAAYVCNSYAIAGFNEKSDIDLFIITHKNYIWLTRLISFFIFHILGIRRFGYNAAGLFCLTFYVSEDNLDLQSITLKPEDPYLMYWVTSLIPLWSTDFDQRIREHNSWAHQWQKHAARPTPFIKKSFISELVQSFFEQIIAYTGIAYLYNIKARKTFKQRYQRRKKSLPEQNGIIITDKMQKLHDTDFRQTYRSKLLDALLKIQ